MPSFEAYVRSWVRALGLRAQAPANEADEAPLRAPLLTAEQMERQGRVLARSHVVSTRPAPDRLLERLNDNRRVLDRACAMLEDAVQAKRHLTPAGEWLLDNVYLIEEQIRLAQRHFPRGYSRELPRLTSGPSAGFPRVYDIALSAISHGDGRVDAESLGRFVAAYQSVTPLRLGELWAIPIMLRLALIENLRRVSSRVMGHLIDRNVAEAWADQLTSVAESDPKSLVLVLADMVRSRPPMSSSFVAELARRLQGQSMTLALPLTWIEQWLADAGHSIEQMVQAESQQQASSQVSISNSIGSIRFLSMMDWRDFVESMSTVEARLRSDPGGVYGLMDFATRDRYRHRVEQIARRMDLDETFVADFAVQLAQARAEAVGAGDVEAHVGFYLVDDGVDALKHALAPTRHAARAILKAGRRLPLAGYLFPMALIVAVCTYGLIDGAVDALAGHSVLWVVAALCVVAFSELGISLVNWGATLLALPRTLPRLDFTKGIPADAKTIVVVPTMFGDADTINALVEALEVRFLANRDANLHFALLTDFFDSASESLPQDPGLLDHAQAEINALNARHASARGDVFFLFHRPREWNPRERAWMGHERKRGKLAALNALLRGGRPDAFLRIAGDLSVLGDIRYVITLDTDTQLPRDAARALVGTLAHPLNRAQFDGRRNVVSRGYGILQPGVGVSMSGQRRSWYARLFSGEPGIDPYTRAVSDVYQDLFGEGSFVGKGIYDIDAFERALEGRFPDNSILSHDLLEGCYARAGLVSDVQLNEDYPARYGLDVKRRQRWIRGDWQLLPWLLPVVPMRHGRRERNPLSWLSRGKVLDNLRRSLVPAAMTTLLVLGWVMGPRPLAWTTWVLAILFVPPLLASLRDVFNKPADIPLGTHLAQLRVSIARQFSRAPITLACMPYEAFFSLQAISTSLWRMVVTRRHLLQWSPSSEVERTTGAGLAGVVRSMWSAPAVAVAVGILLLRLNPAALPVAGLVLVSWAFSPLLMWALGRPRARKRVALSETKRQFLRRLARRTWAFFEEYVDEGNHWLPPDNVQEHPSLIVARRTSPTNVGLALLANLSAYDFGYLAAGEAATRTANTLRTLSGLARFNGHFFNWYDTESLQPLLPRYVSTVDSGNLCGHLLTLRQGLLELIDQPVLPRATFGGLRDTLDVLAEMHDAPEVLQPLRQALDAAIAHPAASLVGALSQLVAIRTHAEELEQSLSAATEEARHWAASLRRQSHAFIDDIASIAPWCQAGAEDPWPSMAGVPTLRDIAEPASSLWTASPLTDAQRGAAIAAASARIAELERLATLAASFAQVDLQFLYDHSRHLLSIGYNVDDRRLDAGFYDLLASEARLCSFVAIAQGQLPQESWFALGRLLTEVDGEPTLLSWSGSMFEYLMPQLVMPSYEGTLLDQTARTSVERQIEYGNQRDVPWGISESGYNTVDARMNYQYRAFGVPGLGLQRGLAQDLVIAPYASMLALMVAPQRACDNLQRLTTAGFSGRFGLYEAIDYTPARLPRGQRSTVVRSFMAHHQGMGLLSIDYLLHDQPMQRRFVADPEFQATLLLLQERVPRTGTFHPHAAEVSGAAVASEVHETRLRVFRSAGGARPAVQMLSNGRYHTMLTSAGGGYSRLRDMAVTRWREDGTRDCWGNFCYLRDVASGDFWSTSHQPACVVVDGYEAIFSDAKVEFRGHRRDFEMHTEIAVSAEDDIELRRLRVSNRSRVARTIEITTYGEVVLAPAISDELHPAFSNLFVQTEIVKAKQAIVCTRRARAHDEVQPWMFHQVAVHDAGAHAVSYETDRARFIGRGQTLASPDAMLATQALSGSQGSVLDPVVSVRCRITLAPDQSAIVDMVTGTCGSRGECDQMIDKYRDRRMADRVFDLAWTHSQVVRRQINASQGDAQLYERLAGLVVFANAAMRADASILLQNRRGQSGLWGQAISGDLPIVLLKIADVANIDLVRQMVQAHAYWRLKGLAVDLVIWNEDQAGYRQQLQDQIMGLIAAGVEANLIDRPGGIFVRPAQQISHEDRVLMQTVARVIVSDAQGKLVDQVGRRIVLPPEIPLLVPVATTSDGEPEAVQPGEVDDASGQDPWPFEARDESLLFDNGSGGFSRDGREYQVRIAAGDMTPAPWSNVLANENFGCVLSESACGYTWGENAHEFRLTPWPNDPITDTCGEAIYLRDEESGRVWSPSPLPMRGEGDYCTRHGFGYSVYEHVEAGISSELWVYVALADSVKFSVLKLSNRSGRPRRISATGYVEWVLGDLRAKTQMHVVTGFDAATGLLTARNSYNTEFEGRVGFLDADADTPLTGSRTVTGDRDEFLGRNGSMHAPAAMLRERLSGKVGAGLDPCAAIQLPVTLQPGESTEIVFRLGMGADLGDAARVAAKHRGVAAAHDALDAVRIHWLRTLGAVQIETPEPSVDVLANGWLLYQTIACRYLARSGYYQSGGAFGFRDQLQDTMAMVHAHPERLREHLLLSAAHQFPQGDVQHWWHPPADRGVRTQCSDDYLWLPTAACRYLETTQDATVLDEVVPYIEGRPLNPDEESYYDLPTRSGQRETLYQHCVRSLDRGLSLLGQRGLPLIGSGDWNDGMNRVGAAGRGESVWLGFFLFDGLTRFSAVARDRGDAAFADRCSAAAAQLRLNLEEHAWDGEWYRRAWFDDGAPLGSKASVECRIDSIAQSWSVLSGAGEPARARQAMASLDEHLVSREAGLIRLLDPPFDKSGEDPGYIRGYVPGVRENGGQYTHAAVWATMAFAELGDRQRAWELFRMINPVNHALDAAAVAVYKVEPYVAAADVYAVAPHVGRGGWTWYTGSAGWMYRLIIESLLGLHLEGASLRLAPCIPAGWPGFTVRYRYRNSVYRIRVTQGADEERRLSVDGVDQDDFSIALRDDNVAHDVDVRLPAMA
ncbi:glycoside hydrolase family 94 protein [Cognatiluteimonas profundi]|uniref:glycoside hydrolase family 94 protein n=1 Tax=Cognatiluteimonas profundi TaxID=2594501 RepID=UPI00131C1399|nr:glycoside hydrolase family 94 protein [Lysobacter profundi]